MPTGKPINIAQLLPQHLPLVKVATEP